MTKQPRFFYGWVMLAVAIAMAVATMPTQTVVISLFNESFRAAVDTDLARLSLAYTIGTILAALPLPWVGRMADRYGVRAVTACVAVACAASLVLLSRAGHIVVLGGAFFLIRFLGQGALGLLANHTIAMWFERRLGLTHSLLAIIGFAGGSALLPGPVAWLITEHGWQNALVVMAGLVLLLTIPAVLLVFRNKPEDIGQTLDGDLPVEPLSAAHTEPEATPRTKATVRPPPNDPAFTLHDALRTRAFWIIVPIMCANGLIGTALLFHMQVMLKSSGLDATERQTALVNQSWALAFGAGLLLMGWLADRVLPRRLMPFGPFLMLISCVICLAGPAGWVPAEHVMTVMRIGMAFYGVGMSVSVAVGNPTIARYFGRTHHGAIRGAIQMASVAATGVGPFLAGAMYEAAGQDFTPILAVFAATGVPLAAASLFLRPPKEPRTK